MSEWSKEGFWMNELRTDRKTIIQEAPRFKTIKEIKKSILKHGPVDLYLPGIAPEVFLGGVAITLWGYDDEAQVFKFSLCGHDGIIPYLDVERIINPELEIKYEKPTEDLMQVGAYKKSRKFSSITTLIRKIVHYIY
jgi:hypothetical protein